MRIRWAIALAMPALACGGTTGAPAVDGAVDAAPPEDATSGMEGAVDAAPGMDVTFMADSAPAASADDGSLDATGDGAPSCVLQDAEFFPPDGSAGPSLSDPCGACAPGFVCVLEIGGVAGGGGAWCLSVPSECDAGPTCECMASCACTNGFGGRPERCTTTPNAIDCDNGIR